MKIVSPTFLSTMQCKGRYVSDILGVGRFQFQFQFHNDKETIPKYYHIPIYCKHKAISDELCAECLVKREVLKTRKITKTSLTGSHPAVLHGKSDEPIPIWSHIENGEWFKKMEVKGYKVEEGMVKVKKKSAKILLEEIKKKKQEEEQKKIEYYIKDIETVEEFDEILIEKITLNNIDYYYNKESKQLYTMDYEVVSKNADQLTGKDDSIN